MAQNLEEDLIIIEEKITKNNGDVITRQYQKGRYLGKGGFARCYEFTDTESQKLTAAKIVPKSTLAKSNTRRKLMSEIKIHKSLHHPSIVGFEHFFEDSENVYILLELCTNQTMNDLIKRRKRLTEIEVQCYLTQIISGLIYLHGHKVIHRDLKLGNFFISEKMEIKIGDFGLATLIRHQDERKKTICGTPNYIAPEVLDGKGHSFEVDIWALGVITYTLLVGKPPFETTDVKTTYRRIKMNAFSYPENISLSEVSKDFINRILITDPSSRLSLAQIQQHEFFQAKSIPKTMPSSTLACPPSTAFLKMYLPQQTSHFHNASKMQETAQSISKNSPRTMREEGTNHERTQRREETDRNARNTVSIMADVCVHKWVDYSNKYGLGYLLTNGSTGVYYNDSTKILIQNKSERFKYFERKSGDKQDSATVYGLNDYPRELQKKVTLLNHFKNYLEGELRVENSELQFIDRDEDVFVKKWTKTKHAIMFRLSNKIVQVKFQDHTEIILSSESRVVTYINKRQEKSIFPLATALESTNQEMTKRLKYTKELLSNMLNNNRDGEPEP